MTDRWPDHYYRGVSVKCNTLGIWTGFCSCGLYCGESSRLISTVHEEIDAHASVCSYVYKGDMKMSDDMNKYPAYHLGRLEIILSRAREWATCDEDNCPAKKYIVEAEGVLREMAVSLGLKPQPWKESDK